MTGTVIFPLNIIDGATPILTCLAGFHACANFLKSVLYETSGLTVAGDPQAILSTLN